MSLLNHFEDSAKFADKGLANITAHARLELIHRKFAYLSANKWLKEQGLITRFKARKDIAQYCSPEWDSFVWGLLRGIFIVPTFQALPLVSVISKSSRNTFKLRIEDGYNGYLGYRDVHSIRRGDLVTSLANVATPFPIRIQDTYKYTRSGISSIIIDYSKIDLLTSSVDAKSIVQTKEAFEEVATILNPILTAGKWVVA